MVTFECSDCGKTKEFPDRATVVEPEINGWVLDIEDSDGELIVRDAYCLDCQSE